MKLGYKLAHAVLGRNVCLEVEYEDAQEIAKELRKLDVFESSEAFRDLVAEVEEGNLAALEKAAKQWDFENSLRDERQKKVELTRQSFSSRRRCLSKCSDYQRLTLRA